MTRGAVYVAYGDKAKAEAQASITSLKAIAPQLEVAVISDGLLTGVTNLQHNDLDQGGRIAKLSLLRLSPFDLNLYLDADTRVLQDPTIGFTILEDGWDIAMASSRRQGADLLGNCPPADRAATIEDLGYLEVLGLQAGVMFIRKCKETAALFREWLHQWYTYKDQDQGALLKALNRYPVKIWLLGSDWNGGNIIAHNFGAAAR